MLTSLTCAKGDLVGNLARHRGLAELAGDHGCDLVLLPEMSLTGYRPSAAVALDHLSVTELVAATSDGPALCFGLVETDRTGGRPFITQLIADHGQRLCCVGRSGGNVEPRRRRSDGESEFIEDHTDSLVDGCAGGEVVVAASEVLHERMTASKDPC